MVWQKKVGTANFVNLLEQVGAMITGTPDEWILPWFDLAPINANVDVEAFCAAGPPQAVIFGPSDFLGYRDLLGMTPVLGAIIIGEKVGVWAANKLFQAYCENTVSGGFTFRHVWTGIYDESPGVNPFSDTRTPVSAGDAYVQVTLMVGGTGGVPDMHCHFFTASSYLSEAFDPDGNFGAVGQSRQYTIPSGAAGFLLRTNSVGSRYDVELCTAGSTEDFVPTPIVQPDSAIPPPVGVYTTIADLGAKLDSLQNKLHWVLNFTSDATITQIAAAAADELVDVVDGEDIALATEVIGFIVSVANIGNQTDERFGEPRQLHRLGRVVLGNGTAWLPPIEISVSPMLVMRPDATASVVRVHVEPPATATVTTLVRAAPVG